MQVELDFSQQVSVMEMYSHDWLPCPWICWTQKLCNIIVLRVLHHQRGHISSPVASRWCLPFVLCQDVEIPPMRRNKSKRIAFVTFAKKSEAKASHCQSCFFGETQRNHVKCSRIVRIVLEETCYIQWLSYSLISGWPLDLGSQTHHAGISGRGWSRVWRLHFEGTKKDLMKKNDHRWQIDTNWDFEYLILYIFMIFSEHAWVCA